MYRRTDSSYLLFHLKAVNGMKRQIACVIAVYVKEISNVTMNRHNKQQNTASTDLFPTGFLYKFVILQRKYVPISGNIILLIIIVLIDLCARNQTPSVLNLSPYFHLLLLSL
jgi:hypothetical protein